MTNSDARTVGVSITLFSVTRITTVATIATRRTARSCYCRLLLSSESSSAVSSLLVSSSLSSYVNAAVLFADMKGSEMQIFLLFQSFDI